MDINILDERTEILLERVKVLENSLDKTIWNVDELKEAIDDIRNGMHGLKEINTTLRKLVNILDIEENQWWNL